VRGASDNTNVATATVKFPTGNTRGVLPRKGYFWDHPVRVLDHYQAWPTWTQNTGGNSLNLGFDPATGGGPGLAPRAAAGLKYNHPEDRGLPVRNDPALKVGETDSLFQPFAPAERCRQIVFWSVNWKGYEDAEEAMPMDWDISAFNTGAPGSHERHSSQGWNDGVGHPEVATVRSDAAAKSFGLLWRRLGGVDAQPRASRTDAVFVQAPAVAWTGGSFNYADIFLAVRGEQLAGSRPGSPHVPEPITGNPTGNWWFDRNFNGRRDVGPIPRGTRLRARSIARFNAYDPRLFMVLR
jgi:hypothetical protein